MLIPSPTFLLSRQNLHFGGNNGWWQSVWAVKYPEPGKLRLIMAPTGWINLLIAMAYRIFDVSMQTMCVVIVPSWVVIEKFPKQYIIRYNQQNKAVIVKTHFLMLKNTSIHNEPFCNPFIYLKSLYIQVQPFRNLSFLLTTTSTNMVSSQSN